MAFITPFFLTIGFLLALALAFLIYEASLTTNNKLEPIPRGQHAHLSRLGQHDTRSPEHGLSDGFAVPLKTMRTQDLIEDHQIPRPSPKVSPVPQMPQIPQKAYSTKGPLAEFHTVGHFASSLGKRQGAMF